MLEIIKYEESHKKEWDDFCKQSKNSTFLFYRDYMEYHKEKFVDASVLVLNKGKVVALFPCTSNSDKVISHGGLTYGGIIVKKDMRTPLFLEVFDELILYFKSLDFKNLIIKPLPNIFTPIMSQELDYALFKVGAKLVKRDLSTVINLSERGKLSKGRKWIINKAKKSALEVQESQDFTQFLELQNSVLEKHEALAVHNVAELEHLKTLFPDNVKLIFTVNGSDDLLAAGLLFIFDNVVHTQYLATSNEGKNVGALDLLIEQQIEYYKANNKAYFSFGISTTNQGLDFNEGLCQQKESFGGSAIVIDTYEIELS